MSAADQTHELKAYRPTAFERELRDIPPDHLMPMLPLIHKADTERLPGRGEPLADDYFSAGALFPVPCDVFGEDLVYTYVGRPAFRELRRPVCLILDPAPELLQNLFIFDTGAYCTNRYGKIVDNIMDVNQFRIPADTDAVRRFIVYRFGSNENYYRSLPREDRKIEMMDSLEEFDYSILVNLLRFSRLDFDTRCRTLENILRTPVPLDRYLQGVILPESRSESEAFLAFRRRADTGFDILYYDDEQGRLPAAECNSRLDSMLFDYYTDKGYMTDEAGHE